MTNEHKLEPDETVYLWYEPYGTRKFTPAQHNARDFDKAINYVTIEKAQAHSEELRQALHDLVHDLEMRSKWKEGSSHGVVDCGNGVYMKAKAALGEL